MYKDLLILKFLEVKKQILDVPVSRSYDFHNVNVQRNTRSPVFIVRFVNLFFRVYFLSILSEVNEVILEKARVSIALKELPLIRLDCVVSEMIVVVLIVFLIHVQYVYRFLS